MTTTTKLIDMKGYAKSKKYCYILNPDLRGMTSSIDRQEYRHPVISFHELYEYSSQYPAHFRKFYFEYQTHKDDTGHWIPAYSGRIENATFDNIEDINKIVNAANKKQTELSIYGGDKYQNMVIALRAAGYREGHENDGYITYLD